MAACSCISALGSPVCHCSLWHTRQRSAEKHYFADGRACPSDISAEGFQSSLQLVSTLARPHTAQTKTPTGGHTLHSRYCVSLPDSSCYLQAQQGLHVQPSQQTGTTWLTKLLSSMEHGLLGWSSAGLTKWLVSIIADYARHACLRYLTQAELGPAAFVLNATGGCRLQEATNRVAAIASTSAPVEQTAEELYEEDFVPASKASPASQPQQHKQSRRKKTPPGAVSKFLAATPPVVSQDLPVLALHPHNPCSY